MLNLNFVVHLDRNLAIDIRDKNNVVRQLVITKTQTLKESKETARI